MKSLEESLKLLQEKFASWLESFILILPNLILAIIILIIAYFLATKVRKVVKNLLRRIIDNKALVDFLGMLSHICIFLFGGLIAINILKLDQIIFSVLAGVGIVGLAIGFAFQDIAANFIAGIALVFRKNYPFKVGDIVETNDCMGTVETINLRDSMIRTFQGQSIFIPNKLIFEKTVNNYSLLGKRRIDLYVGVSYGDNLEKVKKTALEAIETIQARLQDMPVQIYFEEFGSSSINFQVRFWIPFHKQTDYLEARSEAVMAIKKHFDEKNITIPFPIRTLDFGIKGGTPLSEMLGTERRNAES